MKKLRVKWLLVIAWMIIIFVFSNQPAVVSDGSSQTIVKIFKALGLNLNSVFGDLADFAVRKSAHFLEYLTFSLLIYNACRDTYSVSRSILIAVGLVFCYAGTDEIHQLFVPGRTGRFRDVMIDTSGGATAMLIVYLHYLKKNLSLHKEN